MDFDFFVPVKLVFGSKKLDDVGTLVESLGKKAMVVTYKSITGYTDRVTAKLDEHGIEWIIFDDVAPNPTVDIVDKGAEIAKKNKVDVVIGIGGGSAMDSAKAIAFMANNKGSAADYLINKVECNDPIPVVLITTTAGTGSEANHFSILVDEKRNVKKSIVADKKLFAKVSIVDPELTLSVPPAVTASTGIDIFFHAMEAYLSKNCNPVTEALSLYIMKIVSENLLNVYKDGSNLIYREKMDIASTLGGMVIGFSGTCGIHGLGHPISAIYDKPHGETLTATACAFMKFNIPEAVDKFAEIAKILGADDTGCSKLSLAEKSVDLFKRLMQSVNLPVSLTELGIKKDAIAELSQNAYSIMKNNFLLSPRETSIYDIKKMYEESL